MQLDHFNSAWRQFKLLNGMAHIESREILLIIENAENPDVSKWQRVLFSLVMFAVVTIFCQGG